MVLVMNNVISQSLRCGVLFPGFEIAVKEKVLFFYYSSPECVIPDTLLEPPLLILYLPQIIKSLRVQKNESLYLLLRDNHSLSRREQLLLLLLM